MNEWVKFEEKSVRLRHNKEYFREYVDEETGKEMIEINFDNYYKGRTIAKDLQSFFFSSKRAKRN